MREAANLIEELLIDDVSGPDVATTFVIRVNGGNGNEIDTCTGSSIQFNVVNFCP